MKLISILALGLVVLSGITSCKPTTSEKITPPESLFVSADNFDTIIDNRKTELFTLQNQGGIAVQLTNYGASIVSVITPDKYGNYADITLGYKNIQGYLTDNMNLGCIVGPFANRIGKGTFTVDGKTYQLELNDNGINTLHSGKNAISKKIWTATQDGNKVTMSYDAPDMEAGFPGNIKVTAVYTLTAENRLELKITATSDKNTFINLTNHAYFNLGGEGSGPITSHKIQILADNITPVDSALIPTGELLPVSSTPFDLRNPVVIGQGIDQKENQQIVFGNGYDHNWVLNNYTGLTQKVAVLSDSVSGRFMELSTNQPGLQFYSGNFMNGTVTGKAGKPYNFRNALALEPQFFPDSPNQTKFPSTLLEPGKIYEHISIYSFGVSE